MAMDDKEISSLLKDSLRKYGSVWMRLEGKSMLPFLKSGTMISVRNADIRDIHIGDIVVFEKDGTIIAHRVFRKANLAGQFFLRTKSDISFSLESLISNEGLIGKVTAFKRSGREIKVDNFMLRLLGLSAGFIFPFVARARYIFKPVANHAVQSQAL